MDSGHICNPAIAVDEFASNRHLPGGYLPVDSAARRMAHSRGIRFPFETMLAQNIHPSHVQGGALAIIPQCVGRRKSVLTERCLALIPHSSLMPQRAGYSRKARPFTGRATG